MQTCVDANLFVELEVAGGIYYKVDSVEVDQGAYL